MIGFSGTAPDAEFTATLRSTGARSVILFARNLIDAPRTKALIEEIRALVDWPLVVAIDQEGGRVVRLQKGVTVFPGNAALGALDDEELCLKVGTHTARELAALGIDLVLAPVVDLQVKLENPIVGFRAFSGDPRRTAALAAAFCRGLESGGCSSCLKHFPGLGLATVDPHLGLPLVEADARSLRQVHAGVFQSVLSRLSFSPAVMTTHVLMPALDPGCMATVSSAIVRDLLRHSLGHRGCIIADDLEMDGTRPLGSIEDVVVAAARAGHDLLPICHRHDLQQRAARALSEALSTGQLSRSEHRDSLIRIDTLGRAGRKSCAMTDAAHGANLAARIAENSVRLLRDQNRLLSTGRPWLVSEVFSDDPAMQSRFCSLITPRSSGHPVYLASRLSFHEEHRSRLHKLAEQHRNQLPVLLLSSPRDLLHIPRQLPVITAWGSTSAQLQALAHTFTRGTFPAQVSPLPEDPRS